jgi:hypothetical protein
MHIVFCCVQVCHGCNVSMNQQGNYLRRKLRSHEVSTTHSNVVSHVPGMHEVTMRARDLRCFSPLMLEPTQSLCSNYLSAAVLPPCSNFPTLSLRCVSVKPPPPLPSPTLSRSLSHPHTHTPSLPPPSPPSVPHSSLRSAISRKFRLFRCDV